eukprot:3677785-Rhodomonas_salina.1
MLWVRSKRSVAGAHGSGSVRPLASTESKPCEATPQPSAHTNSRTHQPHRLLSPASPTTTCVVRQGVPDEAQPFAFVRRGRRVRD